jgi:hypothetical protein
MAALLAVGLIAVLGFAMFAAVESPRKQAMRLEAIARALHGIVRNGNEAKGKWKGRSVTYRLESRSVGSTSFPWTEVTVELPRAYPLVLRIRRHRWRDAARIDRGELVDVLVGDKDFDPAFLVHAAPAEVTRILLDDDTRRFLASHSKIELDTFETHDFKLLRLSIAGWHDDLAEATAAIDTVTRLAGRVRDAYAEAAAGDGATPIDRGSVYRPLVETDPTQDAWEAENRAEVRHVAALPPDRPAIDITTTGVVIATLVISALFAVIVEAC